MSRLRPALQYLLALAATGLVIWGAIAWMLTQAYGNAIRSAEAEGGNLARSLAQYEDSSARAIDLSLRLLRDEWLQDRAAFAAAVGRHEEHLSNERVIQVAVLDAGGELLFSRLPMTGSPNFADRDYFRAQKAARADQLHVSAPVFGRVTGRWAIQFSRPLLDAARNFAGLIVVAVPPPALENVYKDIDLGPRGVIMLTRADGEILAHSGGLGDATRVSFADAPGLQADEPPGGHFRAPGRLDGVERFYSYRRLPSFPLTVFVGQSADVVLAPYYDQRRMLLAGGILGTLLLAALGALALSRAHERRRYLEERERLSLELHDGCIQSIYAIGMALESCRRLLDKDPARAAHLLADAGASLSLVIQDLRSFVSGDPQPAQSEEQFVAAIQRAVPQLDAEGPAFSFDIERAAVRALTPEQAVHVQRIAQEAVSNVVRHAGARHARLSLALRERRVALDVSDDGAGIAAREGAPRGFGLHHIQARARKLGGQASVTSTPERGTRVLVEFPQAR